MTMTPAEKQEREERVKMAAIRVDDLCKDTFLATYAAYRASFTKEERRELRINHSSMIRAMCAMMGEKLREGAK